MNTATRATGIRSGWFRRVHRWLAMTFTVTTVFTAIALLQEEPADWVFYVPLFPLLFLFGTGLYLFIRPHVVRWRAGPGGS